MPAAASTRPRSRRARLALAPVLAAGLLLGPAIGVASAHSELTGSDPAADSTLTEAPQEMRLTFNENPQEIGAELQLTGPDGEVDLGGEPSAEGTDIVAPFPDDLPNGDYDLLYRVTSADGHPISGEIAFTLDLAEEEATTTAPEDATGEEPTTEDATEATSEDAGASAATSAGEDATTAQEQATEEATSEDTSAAAGDDETTSAEPGPQMSSDEAADSEDGGSSAPLIIGIVVAVLAIGGIGGYLASRGGSRSDNDTSGQ